MHVIISYAGSDDLSSVVTALQTSGTLTDGGSGALPDNTNQVIAQALGSNIYYTEDGTTPSATNGHVLLANQAPRVIEGAPSKLRFLQVSTGAKLRLAYTKK